jgi:class 3 adenylate cyclase
VAPTSRWAEYKQVAVLFADVMHSMDIAPAVGPERLREITTVVNAVCRCARSGEHAFRACVAPLDTSKGSGESPVGSGAVTLSTCSCGSG